MKILLVIVIIVGVICYLAFGSNKKEAKSASESVPSFLKLQTADGKGDVISDLPEAVEWGNQQAIDYYINKGVDINAKNQRGDTALHNVDSLSGESAVAMAKRLISLGADVNATDNYGHTALHRAAVTGNVELVRVIVESKADVNRLDSEGHTAFDTAVYSARDRNKEKEPGFDQVINYLMQVGGKSNKPLQ